MLQHISAVSGRRVTEPAPTWGARGVQQWCTPYDSDTNDSRTFLFTDIEGSTRLLDRLGAGYEDVLARHWKLMREACDLRGGEEFGAEGDAMFFAFDDANAALDAAVEAQRAHATYDWGDAAPVRVRMALHTGEARQALGTWLGVSVHYTARTCAAGHGGQILVSESTATLLGAGAPVRSLGEYNLRDIGSSQRLFQVEIPDLPTEFPPLRTPSARVTNLPDQPTTFIGRLEEVADVRRAIAASRLVTITGPGGAGKTRLALEAAGAAGPDFADGVWLIELAELSSASEIAPAVARIFGTTPDDLLASLAAKQLLVVLDNCEHVVEGAADFVHSVVHQTPGVHVLATSREALSLPGERRWPIPPLRMPDDAVRLFVDRALGARADVPLDDNDTEAVAKICRELDAIPLAIELAAARTSVLSPQQILARLDDRFRLLASTRRGVGQRQQTLRALIDWSYDLLDPDEQRALRQLSVFAGSFDIESATAVVGPNALELVDSLARKSLLTTGFAYDGPPRFWLLESLRAYASEALATAGEDVSARHAHAGRFHDLACEGGANLMGPTQLEWLDRLDGDMENLRASIEWHIVTDPGSALETAGFLAPFFGIRSRLAEGRNLLERALAATPSEPTVDRLRALVGVGTIARLQADLTAARAHHEEQLALARMLASDDEIARALSSLGNVALLSGDADAARPLFEESLALRRRAASPRAIALSLNNLGVLADSEGRFEEACRYFEEHLEIMREVGDRRVVAQTLTNLAIARAALGDQLTADSLLSESIEVLRQLGDTRGVAITLAHQSTMARRRGDAEAALSMAAEALRVLDEVGDPIGVGMALENMAAALAGRRSAVAATIGARLLGAASTLPAGQAERGSGQASTGSDAASALRAVLGDDAFSDAFARGVGEGRAGAVALAAETPL